MTRPQKVYPTVKASEDTKVETTTARRVSTFNLAPSSVWQQRTRGICLYFVSTITAPSQS